MHARTQFIALLGFALLPATAAQAGDLIFNDFSLPYLQRLDAVTPDAGDASAVNTVTHMIDPWPRYAGNRRIPGDGQRMADSVLRYRDVSKLPLAPPPISPVPIGTSGMSGSTSAATGSTPAK